MSRLVFHLGEAVDDDNQVRVQISLQEPKVPNSRARTFDCPPTSPAIAATQAVPFQGPVMRDAGKFLYDTLARHPELGDTLKNVLHTSPQDRFPVFVEIDTTAGAEALPWESLCGPDGDFFGLDDRWSFGRIVAGTSARAQYWAYEPPLRVAAVLSSVGVPATGEWDALRAALGAGDPKKVRLLVFVGEDALYTAIEADIAAGRLPGVTLEQVPDDLGALQARVGAFQPHVLHFFCHGSATNGPHLEIATPNDHRAYDPAKPPHVSTLLAEAAQVGAFTSRTDAVPWLVVLNSCDTAVGTSGDVQSLALDVVRKGSVPAVVGMREAVLSDDANLLTSKLYPALLAELDARVAGRSNGPMDWSRLLVGGRAALAARHANLPQAQAAATTKEWTLPVVYVSDVPFVLTASAPSAPSAPSGDRAARLQIEALRKVLAELPADTPSSFRAGLESSIAELAVRLESP